MSSAVVREFPINERFRELCLALEVATSDADSKPAYRELLGTVSDLLENEYVLTGNLIRVRTLRTQGPIQSLRSELAGKNGKTQTMAPKVAALAVRRLLGFVECTERDERWVQLPHDRELGYHFEPPKAAPAKLWAHHEVYEAVVPAHVRAKIYRFHRSAPLLLNRFVKEASAYLSKPGARALPTPPWNQPYEFENGHNFIHEFLSDAEHATSDITVAAVSSYICASIGQQIFLEALKRGIAIRFLLLDFVHGDVKHVARMIRRSPDALCVFANDTLEALLWLRERALAENTSGQLELRVLQRDPQGRWYLIDARGEPKGRRAFIVPRAAGGETKAASVAGGRVPQSLAENPIREVDALWAQARPVDAEWLKDYESWKADRRIQKLLGQDE